MKFSSFVGATLVTAAVSWSCSGPVELGSRRESSCDLSEEAASGPSTITAAWFWSEESGEEPATDVLKARVNELDLSFSSTEMPSRTRQYRNLSHWLSVDPTELPDVFFANGGSDWMQFVSHEPGELERLCPLNVLAEPRSLNEVYFDFVQDALYCEDSLFAIPVGLHRVNTLFVNTRVYGELSRAAADTQLQFPELSELSSLSKFIEVLNKTRILIQEDRVSRPRLPIVLDAHQKWPLQIMAFEGILASLSPDAYRATWMGRPGGETDEDLRPVYEDLADMVKLIGANTTVSEDITWHEGVKMVANGEALFTPMGDWGSTLIEYDQRQDVAVIPFPGAVDTLVYTVDSFVVPRKSDENGSAARTWINRVLTHGETLIDFARAKHAVPPVRGLSDEVLLDFDPAHIERLYNQFSGCDEDPSTCEMLLAVSGLGPGSGVDPCFDDIGLRLAHVAGHPIWETLEDAPSACTQVIPESPEEARTQLVDKLLEVSRTRYAARCRREAGNQRIQ